MYSSMTYEAIYNSLMEMNEWLKKTGIETKDSVFLEIIDEIKWLKENYKNPKCLKVLDERKDIYVASLTEAACFISIFNSFKILKSDKLPRSKLREILNIPLIVSEEIAGTANVNSRNTLFELSLASQFLTKKLDVVGFEDIDILFQNRRINIQCKRFNKSKDFGGVIQEAYEQGQKKISESERFIIALAIEKTEPVFAKLFDVQELQNVEDAFSIYADRFIRQYSEVINKFLDTRFMGFIISAKFNFLFHPQIRLNAGNQLLLIPTVDRKIQLPDYALIESLGKVLK